MLWFNDTPSMAGMLLGYAVELSLKYVLGRSFFHCNVAALKNTATYRDALVKEYEGSAEKMRAEGLTEQTIRYNLGLHGQRLQTWSAAPASIWRYDKMATAVGPDFETLRQHHHAKAFAYPGRTIKHGV